LKEFDTIDKALEKPAVVQESNSVTAEQHTAIQLAQDAANAKHLVRYKKDQLKQMAEWATPEAIQARRIKEAKEAAKALELGKRAARSAEEQEETKWWRKYYETPEHLRPDVPEKYRSLSMKVHDRLPSMVTAKPIEKPPEPEKRHELWWQRLLRRLRK